MSHITLDESAAGVVNTGPGAVHVGGDVNVTVREALGLSVPRLSVPNLIGTFVGREKELKELVNLYLKGKKKKVVLAGPPGFGKTQLAIRFARYCKEQETITNVFWVNFENKLDIQTISELQTAYKNFTATKSLFIFDGPLERRNIFDFEEQINTVDNYILLITSSKCEWGDDITPYILKPLDRKSAVNVFKRIMGKHYSEEDYPLYEDLAAFLECVPLTIQVIAACIRCLQDGVPPENFNLKNEVEKIKQSGRVCFDTPISGNAANNYTKTFYSAIKVLLDKVKDEKNVLYSPDITLSALYGCAFLNSNYIFLNTLQEILHTDKFLTKSVDDENRLSLALTLLNNISILSYTNTLKYINIYKIIQNVLLFHLNENDIEMRRTCYRRCLNFALHNETPPLHICTVLKYTDQNLDIFFDFYIQNEQFLLENNYELKKFEKLDSFDEECTIPIIGTSFISRLQVILENLTVSGCVDSLKKVFGNLGKYTKDYISDFKLLEYAVDHNQIEVLKLLLEYDVNNESVNEAFSVASFRWNSEATALLESKVVNKRGALQEFFRGGWYIECFTKIQIYTLYKWLN